MWLCWVSSLFNWIPRCSSWHEEGYGLNSTDTIGVQYRKCVRDCICKTRVTTRHDKCSPNITTTHLFHESQWRPTATNKLSILIWFCSTKSFCIHPPNNVVWCDCKQLIFFKFMFLWVRWRLLVVVSYACREWRVSENVESVSSTKAWKGSNSFASKPMHAYPWIHKRWTCTVASAEPWRLAWTWWFGAVSL